jgi:hypothetical protein
VTPEPKDHTPTPKEEVEPGVEGSESTSAGTVYVVPPGIVLLLATSGIARRLSARRRRTR